MASTDRASLRDALEFGYDILPIGLPYGKLHPVRDALSVELKIHTSVFEIVLIYNKLTIIPNKYIYTWQ